MNVTKHELLSALLDDEAGEFERRRLLSELQQDQELSSTWQRYALTGELLRNKKTPLVKRDFLAGIHAAIDDEIETSALVNQPEPVEQSTTTVVPLWRTVVQYGAAAGLGAVIMAAGLMLSTTHSSIPSNMVASQNTEAVTLASTNIKALPVANNTKTVRPINRLDPKTQALLKSYIKDHIRYASTTTVVPTVRAVSYNQ